MPKPLYVWSSCVFMRLCISVHWYVFHIGVFCKYWYVYLGDSEVISLNNRDVT